MKVWESEQVNFPKTFSRLSREFRNMPKSFFLFFENSYRRPFKIYNHPIYFQEEQQIANLNENLKELEDEVTYPSDRKTSQLRYSSSETKKKILCYYKKYYKKVA